MTTPKIRAKLSRAIYEQEPIESWNSFLDVVCGPDYEDLTPTQRVAHLTFWYWAEWQNGGHVQYFENKGTDHLDETLTALTLIKAEPQREILEKASQMQLSEARGPVGSVFEFVSRADEGDYEELDTEFFQCKPHIGELLEAYLAENFAEFIELV